MRTSPVGRLRAGLVTALVAALAAALGAGLTACSVTLPTDPEGTLDDVRGGTLRVGVSANPPWTYVVGDEPTGTEPELVEAFAEHLDAEVLWTTGGEQDLVRSLEHGELEIVVGGLTADSPWSGRVALTRPYVRTPGPDGTELHVVAAPAGENAFLVELERFLLSSEVQP